MGYPIKIYRRPDKKCNRFSRKNLSKLVTMVMQLVDLQTTQWDSSHLMCSEAKRAPVLIQTSMGAAIHGWLQSIKPFIENLRITGITVPVAIHLGPWSLRRCS